MVRFLAFLTSATVVVGGTVVLLAPLRPSFLYQTTGLLFLGTVGIVYLVRSFYLKHGTLVVPYLASIVFKVIIYGLYLFLVIRLQPDRASDNAIFFGILYLVYTFFEIGYLYQTLRKGPAR